MKAFIVILVAALLIPAQSHTQELTKVPFPYGPLGLNSVPFVIAKEARLFEKHGLAVDMVYVGASAVMVQSMLSGAANLAAFGGPAVITNVLSGGDIIQIAALLPNFTQSLMVRGDIRDLRSLAGKKIGITRFGSVTDFALRTLLERNNLKDVSTLQMGGFPEAVAALIRGAIDGAVLSPPHTFRLFKEGYRELVTPKDLRALGSGFLSQGIVARRSYASTHRDITLRLLKAAVEGVRFAHANEDFTKRLIGKYLGIADAELLRQSYSYVTDNFARDPSVPESVMQSMVQRMAQLNMIDAKAAQATPTGAYYDNSFVNELKQSGFLDNVWK
ncbi:MAG: ABC transporter substrate-binding protein [Deltaproteobacteria bacterium]|nr:ABC transporter substrate-binding protein [Deltaproteobacteria bacterium]